MLKKLVLSVVAIIALCGLALRAEAFLIQPPNGQSVTWTLQDGTLLTGTGPFDTVKTGMSQADISGMYAAGWYNLSAAGVLPFNSTGFQTAGQLAQPTGCTCAPHGGGSGMTYYYIVQQATPVSAGPLSAEFSCVNAAYASFGATYYNTISCANSDPRAPNQWNVAMATTSGAEYEESNLVNTPPFTFPYVDNGSSPPQSGQTLSASSAIIAAQQFIQSPSLDPTFLDYWYAYSSNLALGPGALSSVTLADMQTGGETSNVGVGPSALFSTTTGSYNTALGVGAGNSITTGGQNVAVGFYSLGVTTGSSNNAVGMIALSSIGGTYSNNNAFGWRALLNLTGGNSNTALGDSTLEYLLTGSGNIAVGEYAGVNYTGSESNNLDIFNQGVTGDSGVIRIGTSLQNASFMVGPLTIPITGSGSNTNADLAAITCQAAYAGAGTAGVGAHTYVTDNDLACVLGAAPGHTSCVVGTSCYTCPVMCEEVGATYAWQIE